MLDNTTEKHMTNFFDFESLCFGLKKAFADDFNKKILPNVSHDPNIKLIPENVEFLFGPFMTKFFGPNTKVNLLTSLYQIFDPENLIDRVVNGVSLEEAASLDKNITLNKFMGEYSVTSVPFYARTNKKISNKVKADLEKFSSLDCFTKDDIMTFSVVNYLCYVMRKDLTSMINRTDKPIEANVNSEAYGKYKAIEPFMQVKDPQIIKLFKDHELTPKEQEKMQVLQDYLDEHYNPGMSCCLSHPISFKNQNGHFEMTLPLPKVPIINTNNEIKASIEFTNVNDLARKLTVFCSCDNKNYYLSKDLNDIKCLCKDDPLSLYPSCYINHVEYDNFAGNILYLSSLFSGVLNKCCQIDRNHKVALSH